VNDNPFYSAKVDILFRSAKPFPLFFFVPQPLIDAMGDAVLHGSWWGVFGGWQHGRENFSRKISSKVPHLVFKSPTLEEIFLEKFPFRAVEWKHGWRVKCLQPRGTRIS